VAAGVLEKRQQLTIGHVYEPLKLCLQDLCRVCICAQVQAQRRWSQRCDCRRFFLQETYKGRVLTFADEKSGKSTVHYVVPSSGST
jgi:hypothetical protein